MARKAIELVTIEAASLRIHAREAFTNCFTQGRALAALGESVIDAVAEGVSDAPADDLLRATTRLRSAILHGLSLLNELQTQSAKLEEIAAIRLAQV
ncbi:MAG TPA: hypothetical protein VIK01_12310 [Polyangiaceae bacterium]